MERQIQQLAVLTPFTQSAFGRFDALKTKLNLEASTYALRIGDIDMVVLNISISAENDKELISALDRIKEKIQQGEDLKSLTVLFSPTFITTRKITHTYDQVYRGGEWYTGYQPSADVFPEQMNSWEVFGSLANGMKAYPDIPKEKWIKFDFLKDPNAIEDPDFLD